MYILALLDYLSICCTLLLWLMFYEGGFEMIDRSKFTSNIVGVRVKTSRYCGCLLYFRLAPSLNRSWFASLLFWPVVLNRFQTLYHFKKKNLCNPYHTFLGKTCGSGRRVVCHEPLQVENPWFRWTQATAVFVRSGVRAKVSMDLFNLLVR